MKIILNELQRKKIQDAQSFIEKEIGPFAKKMDSIQEMNENVLRKLLSSKYAFASVPEEIGGLGLDPLTYGLVTEEFSKVCSNTRGLITVNNSIVAETDISIISYGGMSKFVENLMVDLVDDEIWVDAIIVSEISNYWIRR